MKTIFFDLDGTIIDTEKNASLVVKQCLEAWNIRCTQEDIEYVTGRTWESAYDFLFRKYSIPIPVDEAKTIIATSYRKSLEEQLFVVPGSVEAVQSLAQKFPLALVSGSYRSDILWAIRKLGIEGAFKLVLGAEDYHKSKPSPDGYVKASKTLGVSPEHCLVFEDSTAGIESARTAGMWVIAVTSTNHFRQDQSKAHHKIKDFTGVNPEWVKKLTFHL